MVSPLTLTTNTQNFQQNFNTDDKPSFTLTGATCHQFTGGLNQWVFYYQLAKHKKGDVKKTKAGSPHYHANRGMKQFYKKPGKSLATHIQF